MYQVSGHDRHCSSRPTRGRHGIFYNISSGAYESGLRYIAEHGYAAVEAGGGVNLYTVFDNPIGNIECSGQNLGPSITGKMPLANNPSRLHWYPYHSGDGGENGLCAHCGRPLLLPAIPASGAAGRRSSFISGAFIPKN